MTAAAAPTAPQPLRRHTTKASASAEAPSHRASLADQLGGSTSTKNVIVLGGSYGGMHAASVLANRLPPSHRVILIERNSHFNHLYVFPRFSVLPGHEHKAFIPYTAIFKDAPKRRQRKAASTAEGPSSPSSSRPLPASSGRSDLLGMGSMSGGVKALKSKSSTTSTNSDRSSDDGRLTSSSRFGNRSSISRSSSVDNDDPLFDQRLRVSRGDVSDSYSIASSYRSTSSDHNAGWTEDAKDAKDAERAQMLAGSEGVVQAAVEEGIASRAQEALGRPEMEVQDLSSALDKGISLDDGEGAAASTSDADQSETFDESSPHLVLQASVESITPSHVIVRSVPDDAPSSQAKRNRNIWSIDSVSIPYSHLIYALGSHLPDPLRTEKRFKQSGVQWMQEMQQRVKDSQEIVLVGGGALGVEFATDIKCVYPDKSVTLIHSRKQLLPNFDAQVHELALQRLNELGVQTVLGERLALTEGCPRGSTVRPEDKEKSHSTVAPATAGEVCPTVPTEGEGEVARKQGVCLGNGRKLVKTTGGKQFECDLLLLCTGQQPNSEIMAKLSPTSVDSNTRLVRVMQTLQVKVPDPHGTLAQMPFDPRPPCGDCDCFLDKKAAGGLDDVDGSGSSSTTLHRSGGDTCLSNVYAIGDVADAFGALNAGYQAWTMADVATENVLRDIEANGKPAELQSFTPAPNLLKLSLGLGQKVVQNAPNEHSNGRPVVELCEDEEDLAVEGVWKFMAGLSTEDMYI